MASVPYDTRSSWSWPEDIASQPQQEAPLPGAFAQEEPQIPENVPEEPAAAKPPRHYPPRTCRICLEVVLPTYEPVAEGLASLFNPTPAVSYISQDPESGRLIRPCKCRGSSRYVHEGCLQSWRHADPAYGRKNFWECPTCHYRYRLERMKWGRWISNPFLQILLTIAVLFLAIFISGFVADPIINLYLDPYDTITSLPKGGPAPIHFDDDEVSSWTEHFVKGLASLGLIGFVKVFFAMSPWHWWNLRQTTGAFGGGRARGNTGRDRLENISWSLVIIGVFTFLYATWKFIRRWSKKTLEKAGERVADVQGEDDDFEEVVDSAQSTSRENGGSTARQRAG